MHVDAAVFGYVKIPLGQKLPERCAHHQLRRPRFKRDCALVAFNAFELKYLKAVFARKRFDRRHRQRFIAPNRPVRLRKHAQVVSCIYEALQRGQRKFRRAQKSDSHLAFSSSCFSAFSAPGGGGTILSLNSIPSRWSVSWHTARAA
ncbi:hypothetical protein SDC9_138336 [bioreactor metagenome]|uniref:Uncharacterized protein n=1 Tax=bioreactor metagenome TaxID=1076179 RepID=A0A645DPQ8_9ZZZZ